MKRNLLLRVALACLIALTSTGCASNRARLRLAAIDTGTAAAGVTLPDLPSDCREQEAHAPLSEGMEARTALRRERKALDRQNARGGRCADFYDGLQADLQSP